ncbi:MAG: putative RNA uridine N3 methyltransferase [Bacillota bacterium]
MDKKRLSIAIPASAISDTPHLREKTAKLGLIGRAAAIFRVDQIIVYSDNPKVDQRRDLNFIALLLKYLETPQYLRKRLFGLEADLEFAGILPPLRTPHHPISGKTKHLKVGEYREGVVLSETKEGLIVDIGVQQPALLRQKEFALGDRLTLQVVNIGKHVEVQVANRDDVPQYWGYSVQVTPNTFGKMMQVENFDLSIATARIGDSFTDVADNIGEKWRRSLNILVAFGAPSCGLHEIAQDEGLKLAEIVDFVVNTVPNQGTATVRMEEALLASLAILNLYFGC